MTLKTMFQSLVIDYYDREIIQPRQALRTVIAALLSFLVMRIVHWPRHEWILFTAVFLIQARLGETRKKCLWFVAMTCLTGLLGISLAALLANHLYWLLLLFAFTTFFTVYIGVYGVEYSFAAFYVNLYFLMGAYLNLLTGIDWMVLPNIVIGEVIIFFVILIFWPPHLESDFRIRSRSSLILLKKLFQQTMKSFYDVKHYEFSCIRCRARIVRIFITMARCLNLLRNEKSPYHAALKKMYDEQQKIYQIIVAIGLYRYRLFRHELAKTLAREYDPFFKMVSEYLQGVILKKDTCHIAKEMQRIFLSCVVQHLTFSNIEQKSLQSFHTLLNELMNHLLKMQQVQ